VNYGTHVSGFEPGPRNAFGQDNPVMFLEHDLTCLGTQ
jgi:hypothetical protein